MEREALLALVTLNRPDQRKHTMPDQNTPTEATEPRFLVMPAAKVPYVLRDLEHPDGPQDYPFVTERNARAAAIDLDRLRDVLPAKSPSEADVYNVLLVLAEEAL